jgi:hypothetical protein
VALSLSFTGSPIHPPPPLGALRETKPELWLADYRLACQLGGTDDDNLIICNLPLFLSDAA